MYKCSFIQFWVVGRIKLNNSTFYSLFKINLKAKIYEIKANKTYFTIRTYKFLFYCIVTFDNFFFYYCCTVILGNLLYKNYNYFGRLIDKTTTLEAA